MSTARIKISNAEETMILTFPIKQLIESMLNHESETARDVAKSFIHAIDNDIKLKFEVLEEKE